MRIDKLLLLQLGKCQVLGTLDLTEATLPHRNLNHQLIHRNPTPESGTYRFSTITIKRRTHVPLGRRIEKRQCFPLADGPR